MPRAYHHGDLARALVDAAEVALEAEGADALTLKGLAAGLGVSHTAVYRHFADRRALLAAVAGRGLERLEAAMERASRTREPGTRDELLAVGFAVVQVALARPRIFALMTSGLESASLRELGGLPEDLGFGALRRRVRGWQASGVLGEGEPDILVLSLWTTTLGLAQLLVSGTVRVPKRDLRAFVDAAHGRMLDGLSPRPPARLWFRAMSDSPSAKTSPSGFSLVRPDDATYARLVDALSPEERRVLVDHGTERPFCGGLLEHKEPGTYVCRLCALPLFKSAAKFESGTGWPSFYEEFDAAHVKRIRDTSHGMTRVEIRCARCDGHLGHVFPDGPKPTGERHCLNSASLAFVPDGSPLGA